MTDADLPPQIRQRTVAKAHVLLEALPFMQEHHGKVHRREVRRRGHGARAARRRRSPQDIALLQQRRDHAGRSCTAAGRRSRKMSASLGIETTFVDGVRVTDAETLDVATMVLAGKLNTDVVARRSSRRRRRRSGCPASTAGCCSARKQTAPDLGFVGEVVHVNADVVRTLMAQAVRARSWRRSRVDEFGQAYNVNADVVAAELAIALDAREARVPRTTCPG